MSIILERLTKWFGRQLVVDRVSLEVSDGELFVLLGSSGSGKSTILRQIAGLSQPDDGRILLHGRDVTHLPPQQRGAGFVFQNYSIFRHMNVADNIEFGLKIRRFPPAARARKRDELLDLVGLAGLGERFAGQLSGGQQQRVALARALAYEPAVLLLDEPFGALDVKIRAQLRRTLKQIQRQLKVTTILVTHDQEEAFELGDRIGVLERGQLLEVGPPEILYARPRTSYVATFLGAGMVLVGRQENGRALFGDLDLPLPDGVLREDGGRVQILFRPEQVVVGEDQPPENAITIGRGEVVDQAFTGASRRLRLRLPPLQRVRQIAPIPPFGEGGLLVDALIPAGLPVTTRSLWVSLTGWHLLQPPAFQLLVYAAADGRFALPPLAGFLAERLQASLTVLGVKRDSAAIEAARRALEEGLAASGARAELRMRQGEPLDQIQAELAGTLYDLLLLPVDAEPAGGSGKNWPGSLVGSILENMNGRWTTPVLITRGQIGSIKRILICTAGGEPGKSDVRVGGRLAWRFGAAVTLLYVAAPADGELSPTARVHLERAARMLRGLDIPCEVAVRSAPSPREGIIHAAAAGDYDLIVLGSHGPQFRSIFGWDDITYQVVSSVTRPVLIVPFDPI